MQEWMQKEGGIPGVRKPTPAPPTCPSAFCYGMIEVDITKYNNNILV